MENPIKPEEKNKVSQTIDFYKIFKVFLSRWYWIAGCVVIALVLAKININYTPDYYSTSGEMRLKESNPTIGGPNSISSSTSYNYTDRIQAEGFLVSSQAVLLNAAKVLDYKIAFFLKERWGTREVYPLVPFSIKIVKQDTASYFNTGMYHIAPVDAQRFSLNTPEDAKDVSKVYRYGQIIKAGNMQFSINSHVPQAYFFKFNSLQEIAGRLGSGLSTSEASRFTNVMRVSKGDNNATFAADAINVVMKEYIKYDLIDKQKSARQMVNYIDQQLGFINQQVDSSGTVLANYKTSNNIINISSTSAELAGKLTDLQSQRSAALLERSGIEQLQAQLKDGQGKLQPNANLEGPVSGLLGGLVNSFNSLVDTRTADMVSYGANSSRIELLNTQIANIQASIQKSINAILERNNTTLQFLDAEMARVNQQVQGIPDKEQAFVKLQSTFDINTKYKSLLEEKRLEAEMNAAAVVPGAEIVNLAYPSTYSIGVDKNKTYMMALVAGLAAGVGLILLVRFLNPYIYDKETVEALTRTPIIGVIRKFPEYIDKNNRQALSLSKPKSVFAESVRSVRTNLSFMASHKKSKIICITSEISGEGKSFVTVNLASTMALIEKKVVLIAADLRKSKLHKAFGADNRIGLSTYLSGQSELSQVMVHDDMHNIDFIPSGPVPPNPSELLHSEKMTDLLNSLIPLYDYVLVDTAPVGLVSDAIPLIRQSDVNLFVIRSGKSQFRAASIPERLSREYSLNNMAIVLNAFGDDALHSNYYTTDYARGGGNSTYYYSDYSGYVGNGYYDNEPKRWWEFWKKK